MSERNEYPYQMIEEALDELIICAKFSVFHDKKFGNKLGRVVTGNLGYPSAIILFSIIDIIGNCFKDNKNLEVVVDGKKKFVSKKSSSSFYILNSKYFHQDLKQSEIDYFYDRFRSKLIHNGLIGAEAKMFPTSTKHKTAFFSTASEGKGRYSVSLEELFYLCEKAVNLFKFDLKEVVEGSRLGKKFP